MEQRAFAHTTDDGGHAVTRIAMAARLRPIGFRSDFDHALGRTVVRLNAELGGPVASHLSYDLPHWTRIVAFQLRHDLAKRLTANQGQQRFK
jgi:hypothetical protein